MDRVPNWRNRSFCDRPPFLLVEHSGAHTCRNCSGIALNLIKQAVHAPRPLTVFAPDIAAGRVYINVMFDTLYYYSFPSGHAQTIFTVATVLMWSGMKARKLNFWSGVAIVVIAIIVGTSRVYCGAHFPSDVLGGSVLGSGTAWVCCYVIEKIKS